MVGAVGGGGGRGLGRLVRPGIGAGRDSLPCPSGKRAPRRENAWYEGTHGMSNTIVTLIAGDGIGPEVAAATVRVLAAAGAELDWEPQVAGAEALARCREPPPQ